MAELLELGKVLGFPIAISIMILVFGARKVWHFGSNVQQMRDDYETRLTEKNTQIAKLTEVADTNAKAASEATNVTKQVLETVKRLEAKLDRAERAKRSSKRTPSSVE